MRRLRIWAGLFAACLAALPCWAQARQPAKPDEPPQLIVAISIDQFSADLFGEYRASFVHGFKRLTEGVVFPRAYQSHAGTETCPGHSTILTGARPGRTGIIANNWIDQSAPRVDKTVYCLEDPHIPGSSSTRYTVSSRHLRVPTLGDRMKAADSGARVVSVAGKDRAALLLGGRSTDAIWWIGPEGFTTLPDRSPTPEVDRANVRFRAALASPRAMMPMLRHCEARDLAIDLGRGKQVGRGRFQRIAGDLPALRASPDADGMVIDLAIALAKALALGRRGHTDLLSVGLSATDHIGHSFGNGGVESCLQVAALDRALGRLFDRLDARGIDYVVMLTADHGAHDIPERHLQTAMPREQRVDASL